MLPVVVMELEGFSTEVMQLIAVPHIPKNIRLFGHPIINNEQQNCLHAGCIAR
jgi:hypothetical protein